MDLRFFGTVAEAAGTARARVAIQGSVTVAELLTILVNLYPGLGRPGGPYRTGKLQVRLNGRLVTADERVADSDRLSLTALASVIDFQAHRGGIG
jgi:molybdopterin converting factor small subunit